MRFDLITLFPDIFDALNHGMTGRALRRGFINLHYWNPRDFSHEPYRRVDDRPYGGGPGMVMQFAPLYEAIQAAKSAAHPEAKTLLLTPQGQTLTQSGVKKLATYPGIILVNGRYEGIDERLVTACIDETWSIGDYVLSGGEIASLVLIDSVTRLLPGVLGDPKSAECDSFSDDLLDFPQYTRPAEIQNLAVPEILLSGDHQAIARWRLQQALGKTWQLRPDMLKRRILTSDEQDLLDHFINGEKNLP